MRSRAMGCNEGKLHAADAFVHIEILLWNFLYLKLRNQKEILRSKFKASFMLEIPTWEFLKLFSYLYAFLIQEKSLISTYPPTTGMHCKHHYKKAQNFH